jgi:hypothetical protein
LDFSILKLLNDDEKLDLIMSLVKLAQIKMGLRDIGMAFHHPIQRKSRGAG